MMSDSDIKTMGLLGHTNGLNGHTGMMDISCVARLKLVLVGDQNVGKTSLLTQFSDDVFPTDPASTIGTDFKIRTVDVNGKWVKIQLWDTAGQERYKTIIKDYYRDAQGVMFVYDVTKEKSFNHIMDWIDTVNENAPENVERIIVGNKCDSEPWSRRVDSRRAEAVANHLGFMFMETSAKTNTNVDEAFMMLTRNILQRTKLGDSVLADDSIKIADDQLDKDRKCGCTMQ